MVLSLVEMIFMENHTNEINYYIELIVERVLKEIKVQLSQIILFGSSAREDYDVDSEICFL